MDLATIIGFTCAFLLVIFGISLPNLAAFIDPPSLFIAIGGAVSATVAAFPANKLINSIGVVKNAFFVKKSTPVDIIKQLVSFAEQARREGILALEARALEVKDEFLKTGIQLAVDGTEPELIKDILSTDIAFTELRHEEGAKIFDFLAAMGPSFGMIGTLIGLVLMLGNMTDVESIGPNMAVALITTFYGSLLANAVCLPIVEKLKGYSRREILIKELMLEGIMSLQSGDNPRIVEQKLTAFLEPGLRAAVMKEKGK
ncbi:motility protein A [Chitinispirillales bacterium ANBcel5]|uniref:motility protein A n=1 Tax=Cellulosispirillum alkaliphilum TaxID=3039283 RepID=UPI002A5071C8|nr:motility protein A [Chitinispirillales bacterium ANBcel5]